jgi:undecaprenyl-diphosphatase
MLLLLQIIILAVAQGIGEFLPISSSGHVVVLLELFKQVGQPMGKKLPINVVLHLGTLLAILVFYRARIRRLLGRDRHVIVLLAAGSLPAAAVGLLMKWYLGEPFENALFAGLMFPLTGVMLLWSARKRPGSLDCRELSLGRALWIGVFQALAILPGISRSGATIVAGLGCGLRREEAAAFSFLLAIPVMAGAGAVELVELLRTSSDSPPLGLLAFGAVVSFAVGLASLAWLLRWLQQGRLHHFAWWVLLLGPAVVVWQLWWA